MKVNSMELAKSFDLSGQVALVTGGARGIGREVAVALAASGATVVVNYRESRGAADELIGELRERGGEHEALQFDVAEAREVERAIAGIIERRGRLDILVNNAGVASDGLLVRTREEEWRRTVDINLSGAFYCARAAAKQMIRARNGRIISISSVVGEMGNAGQVSYAASKSGLFGLTKSLAKELGSRNVTANAVTPGYILTDMTRDFSAERTEALLDQIPLGRLGTPADVAGLVVFLASPLGSYITGQIIGVNGGLHM